MTFLAFARLSVRAARWGGLALAFSALAACAAPGATAPATPAPPAAVPAPAPGSDRDAHGCIPSAGYQWCQRTNRCERSWELAQKEGFARTAEGFQAFCAAPKR